MFYFVLQGVNHHLAGETELTRPVAYTIKDDVVYSIDIEEYRDGNWIPYNGKLITWTA